MHARTTLPIFSLLLLVSSCIVPPLTSGQSPPDSPGPPSGPDLADPTDPDYCPRSRRAAMSKRPRHEIVKAVRRLQQEDQEPVADVAAFLGMSRVKAESAIIRGVAGVYLDGLHDPKRGCWVSSIPAAVRFARDLAALDEEDRERVEGLARRGIRRADVTGGVGR